MILNLISKNSKNIWTKNTRISKTASTRSNKTIMSKMITSMPNMTSRDGGILSTEKILVWVIGLLETLNVAKNIWISWEEHELVTTASVKSSKESALIRTLSKKMITLTSSVYFAKSLCKIHVQFETACINVRWKEFFATY